MLFQVGDIVARTSYGADIHFRIVGIDRQNEVADLKGIDTRLFADAPLDDLVLIDQDTRGPMQEKEEEQTSSSIKELKDKREQGDFFYKLPGRVLHVDGDARYLKKCLALYRELDIPVYGIHLHEKKMPEYITLLLNYIKPNILVLTGHDAYLKATSGSYDDVQSYKNSLYFKKTVKAARHFERDMDQLIIFAGACQSHFEAMIEAGANYASSPERINIHALDPVYIVEKACYTPIHRIINLKQVLEYTIMGSSGIGGIDSKGTFRTGTPRITKT